MRGLLSVLCISGLAIAGCSAAAGSGAAEPPSSASAGSGGASVGGGSGAAAGTAGGAGAGGDTEPAAERSVGMVVIDVQQTFVEGAANGDLSGVLARTKAAFELASAHGVPFFITYEASKQGDHALEPALQPVLPAQAKELIKTTFAATGLPAFADALQQSGLSHLVVLGAETDVCVLQSVLGLRQLGFTVLLQHDAVFSSEPNVSPALRRMQQAGVLLVSQAEVSGFVAQPSTLPDGDDAPVTVTKPLEMGVVLNGFTDAALAASADALEKQKSARLRELLLVSEWFELPVYVSDPSAGLPATFAPYFKGPLRPLSQIAQDGFIHQLVVAGTDGGVADVLSSLGASHQLFLMEDALLSLGTAADQKATLASFFEAGLVPTTYKSFYYGMTRSVDPGQWPSQTWVQRFEPYYDLTLAPEDLPPMPPS